MIEVFYKPTFIRAWKKLDKRMQEKALKAIELFKHPKNHKKLLVHKLKAHLAPAQAFSIDFHMRIAFLYISEKEVVLLDVGDHKIYQ